MPQRRVVQGREQKDDAGLVQHLGLPLGAQIEHHPNVSSTSAAPHAEDAARLPCLTTLAPAPAATTAAMVEMLTVFARSPPEPTTSTASLGRPIGVARASMASAKPAISSTVSPFARRATRKPAICTGVALPARISSMAQPAASADRFSREISPVSTSGQVYPTLKPPGRAGHAATLPPPPAVAPGRPGTSPRHRRATRWPAKRPLPE